MYAAHDRPTRRSHPKPRRSFWGRVRRLLVVAALLYLPLTLAQIRFAAARDQAAPAEAIVVLGAAQWNGRPSPVLRARLDHAIALYHQGLAPRLVTTGGHGPDPVYTEAGVGARYAQQLGVPASAILTEEVGTNTWQSLEAVAALARAHGFRRIIVVSDPFHIARIQAMAATLGLEALGSPTRTSPISRRPSVEWRYSLAEVWSLTVHRVRVLTL